MGEPGEKLVGKAYFYEKHLRILKRLGLNGLKYDTYGYKHTGNIALVEAGVNIKHVQEQNRHTNLKTTDRYLSNIGAITKPEGIMNFPQFGEKSKKNDSEDIARVIKTLELVGVSQEQIRNSLMLMIENK